MLSPHGAVNTQEPENSPGHPSLSYNQTLSALKQAGYTAYPLDYVDPFDLHYRDLRDSASVCSVHVEVSERSGQTAGQPTVGRFHVDTYNPWEPVTGSAPIPGAAPVQAILHTFADLLSLYHGDKACGP
jgi:hypothetical protein